MNNTTAPEIAAPVANPTKVLLDVREVAYALGCGRTYVYDLISRGDLFAVKLDRLTRVPVSALHDFVQRRIATTLDDIQNRP